MAECPFCFEDFDRSANPWSFPCGHLVCGNCISIHCTNGTNYSCRTCEQTFAPSDTYSTFRRIIWLSSPDVPGKDEDTAKRLVQVLKENRELKERLNSANKDFLETSAKNKSISIQLEHTKLLLDLASAKSSHPSRKREAPVAGPSNPGAQHHPIHEPQYCGRQRSTSIAQEHRYGPYHVGPNPHRIGHADSELRQNSYLNPLLPHSQQQQQHTLHHSYSDEIPQPAQTFNSPHIPQQIPHNHNPNPNPIPNDQLPQRAPQISNQQYLPQSTPRTIEQYLAGLFGHPQEPRIEPQPQAMSQDTLSPPIARPIQQQNTMSRQQPPPQQILPPPQSAYMPAVAQPGDNQSYLMNTPVQVPGWSGHQEYPQHYSS